MSPDNSTYPSDRSSSQVSTEKLSEIVSNIKVPVMVLKPESDNLTDVKSFNYIYSNPVADSFAGYPLTGTKIFLNDDALVFNYADRVMATGITEDVVFHHEKEGKWLHLIVANLGNAILVIKEDITEIKHRLQEAEAQKDHADKIEAATQTGSFTWKLSSGNVNLSDELQRIFGINPESNGISIVEMMGQMYGEDSLRAKRKLQNLSLLPDSAELLYRIKSPQGEVKNLKTTTETVRDKNGKAVAVLGICQDVSTLSSTEEKLAQTTNELDKNKRELERLHSQINVHQGIIDQAFEAVIGINKKGEIISWNGAAEKLYGMTSDYALGRNFGNIVFNGNREEIQEIIDSAVKGNKGMSVSMENVRKDGSKFFAAVSILPYQDVNQRNAGLYALVIPEIVAKSTIPAEVAEPVEEINVDIPSDFVGEVTAALSDKISIFDFENHTIQYSNDAAFWEMIYPLEADDDAVKDSESNISQTDRDRVIEHFSKSRNLGDNETIQTEFQLPDGRYFEIRTKLFRRTSNGEVAQVLSVATDTSEKRSLELELGDQAKILETIAKASPDVFFIMNVDTKEIKYTNRTPAEALGYAAEAVKIMEHPLFDLMPSEDISGFLDHLDRMKNAADGEVIEAEYRLKAPDGTIRWFRDRNTVFKRDEDGIPMEKLGISQDNTDRKASEEAVLRLNRKLDEKNRRLSAVNDELKAFTSIAAYDFRDTLQTLYTNMEYIVSRDAPNLSNTGKANIRKSQAAIQKMKLMTDDIATISKITADETNATIVNLNEVIKDVVDQLNSRILESGATITITDLPSIHGYPFLIKLLLFHIVDNALKFRHPNQAPMINICGDDMSDHVISIVDNGIGIAESERENIFKMFYRVNDKAYRGSGVGLAISKKIVDLHGGAILVGDNTDAAGASIKIQFPKN